MAIPLVYLSGDYIENLKLQPACTEHVFDRFTDFSMHRYF